jgi:hypothetical protein
MSALCQKLPSAAAAPHQPRTGRIQHLYNNRLCRRALDFAHISMVYFGHPTIVPSDRDCIPTHFGDNASVSGIASPINAATYFEAFGFGGSDPFLIFPSHRQVSF